MSTHPPYMQFFSADDVFKPVHFWERRIHVLSQQYAIWEWRRNDCIWADRNYLLTPTIYSWIFRVLPDLGFIQSADSSGESLTWKAELHAIIHPWKPAPLDTETGFYSSRNWLPNAIWGCFLWKTKIFWLVYIFFTFIRSNLIRVCTVFILPASFGFILRWQKPHLFKFELPHDKTNKLTVHPVKTQISLGIRPVWSESSPCTQWVAKDPSFLHTDSKDWSDWADAQADPIFAGGTCHIVGLVMRRLISWKLQPVFQVALLFGLLQ